MNKEKRLDKLEQAARKIRKQIEDAKGLKSTTSITIKNINKQRQNKNY